MNKLDPKKADSHQSMMDFYENVIKKAFENRVLSSAGLVIGSSSKKAVKIANTVTFTVKGLFYSKTTAEVAFTDVTHDIANNASSIQERVYALALQSDGTATIEAGAIATGSGNALFPDQEALANTKTIIGYVRIAVAAGATPFNATGDDLDAAHLTVTYYNGQKLPSFVANV